MNGARGFRHSFRQTVSVTISMLFDTDRFVIRATESLDIASCTDTSSIRRI